MRTQDGYTARWDGTKLIIEDVPIFVESVDERDPDQTWVYDAKWMAQAFRNIQLEQNGGRYQGPLHVRHHSDGGDVRAAGRYLVTRTQSINYQGKPRLAIMADYIVTNERVQREVLRGELPYWSIEIIPPFDKPMIDSVALLDHEKPFFQLPNLDIANAEQLLRQAPDGVASATFSRDGTLSAYRDLQPVLAFKKSSDSVSVLFHGADMAAKKKNPAEFGTGPDGKPLTSGHITTSATFDKDDDGKDDDKPKENADDDGDGDGDNAQGAVDAVLGMLKDGSLPFSMLDALEAGISEARAAAGGDPDPEAQAPAQLPGQATMKKNPDLEFTALQKRVADKDTEIAVQSATFQKFMDDTTREKDVEAAVTRMSCTVGSDDEWRKQFAKYHKDHGAAAFKSHVDTLAVQVSAPPEDDTPASRPLTAQNFSKEALVFSEEGPERVAEAEGFFEQWTRGRENGSGTNLDAKTYVEIRMAKAASQQA